MHSVSPSNVGYGWGTPKEGLYVDSEEVESIVQRTNEKLAAETLQRQRELEARIAQLESKAAWSEVGAPGSAAKAKTQELHGPHRGLASEFDSVATAPVQDAEILPQPDTVHGADHSAAQDRARGNAEAREQDEAETCQSAVEAHEGGLPTENVAPDGLSAIQSYDEKQLGFGDVQGSQSEPQSQVKSFTKPPRLQMFACRARLHPVCWGQIFFAGLQGAGCEDVRCRLHGRHWADWPSLLPPAALTRPRTRFV